MEQTQKVLRRSLWASVLAIILCAAMLLGTTFAWFTDTISSTGNTIQSGTLTITLNGDDADKTLFAADANDRWEPGFSRTAQATVANTGNLWLKYAIQVTIKEDEGSLAKVLDVYTSNQAIESADDLAAAKRVGTVEELEKGTVTLTGTETDKTAVGILAPAGKSETVDGIGYTDNAPLYLAIKMQEGAGNQYQDQTIKFDIDVVATQYTKEVDGFGDDQYDLNAEYPYIDKGNGTFEKDDQLYVNVKDSYIPVTADDTVEGLYTDAEGNDYVATGEAVTSVFAAAQEGENITVLQDITYTAQSSGTYLNAKNATVDLNGKTITVKNGAYGAAFGVTGNGSVVKNGTFRCGEGRDDYPLWVTGNDGPYHVVIENVTVEGGIQVTGTRSATLKNVTIKAKNYYVVYMAQNSKVTVESGTFTNSGNKPHFYIENYSADYNPTVIINGGDFSGGTPTCAVGFASNPYTFTNNLGQ